MRSLREIAAEIRKEWSKPYFGAVPYIGAMAQMDSGTDDFGADNGFEVILRFLNNAKTWRGDAARRIKAELKTHLPKE